MRFTCLKNSTAIIRTVTRMLPTYVGAHYLRSFDVLLPCHFQNKLSKTTTAHIFSNSFWTNLIGILNEHSATWITPPIFVILFKNIAFETSTIKFSWILILHTNYIKYEVIKLLSFLGNISHFILILVSCGCSNPASNPFQLEYKVWEYASEIQNMFFLKS